MSKLYDEYRRLDIIGNSLIDCPQIICGINGIAVYLSDKVKNTIITSAYSEPVYEYMPENERKRFLNFITSQTDFSDFELKSFDPYRHAFAVKESSLGQSVPFINMYLFISRKEMVKSGITSDFMYDIYSAYVKGLLRKFSDGISSSVAEITGGNLYFPEAFVSDITNFIRLAHIMAAGIISVLGELSCDGVIKISIALSGSTAVIDIFTDVEECPSVILGGSLTSLSHSLPSCEIRLIMCEIIASRAEYDVVCSSYPDSDSEKSQWNLKFSIMVDSNQATDMSLKSDPYSEEELKKIKTNFLSVFNGCIK